MDSCLVIGFILVTVLSTSLCQDVRPGIKGRITQAGLDYASNLAIDILMEELDTLQIPDVSEKTGPVTLDLTNIHAVEFPRPSTSLESVPDMGLQWKAWDLSPEIQANYNAQVKMGLIKINKSGTMGVRGRDISFVVDFFIGRDTSTGRPTVHIQSCSAHGDISLGFNGGLSGTLNLFSGWFKKNIRALVLAQICFQAKEQINNKLAGVLDRFPVTEPLFEGLALDYGLVKFPNFTTEYFDIFFKGDVFAISQNEPPPFEPPVIPEHPEHLQKMVYVYVTSYLLNSGLYAAYNNGLLVLEVSADSDQVPIPAEMAPMLQTACPYSLCIGTIFPEIAVSYPDATVALEFTASKTPEVNITNGGIFLNAWVEVGIFADNDEGRHSLFLLHANVSVGLFVFLNNTKVTFDATDITSSLTVTSSTVGIEGTSFFFEALLRIGIQQVLRPKLEEIGSTGFVLPDLEGVQFIDPQIIQTASNHGVLVIGTDVRYDKP